MREHEGSHILGADGGMDGVWSVTDDRKRGVAGLLSGSCVLCGPIRGGIITCGDRTLLVIPIRNTLTLPRLWTLHPWTVGWSAAQSLFGI